MALYRQVDPRMHDDDKFARLTDSQQMLFVTLLTGPQTTSVPGLMAGGVSSLAEIRRRPLNRVRADVEVLRHFGMVEVDDEKRVIRLPNAPKFAELRNQKQLLGWFRAWQALPESQLKYRHIESLRRHLWSDQSWFRPTWERTFGAVASGTVPHTVSHTVSDTVSIPEQNRTEQYSPLPPAGGGERETASPGSDTAAPPTAAPLTEQPDPPHGMPEPDATWFAAWNQARARRKLRPDKPGKPFRGVCDALLEQVGDDVDLGCLAIDEWLALDEPWAAKAWWSANVFPRYCADMATAAAAKRDRRKGPSGPPPKLYPPSDCREFVGLRPTEPELRPYAKAGEFTPEDLARIRDEILAARGESEPRGDGLAEPKPIARDAARRGTLGELVDAKRAADAQPILADELDRRRRAAIDALT